MQCMCVGDRRPASPAKRSPLTSQIFAKHRHRLFEHRTFRLVFPCAINTRPGDKRLNYTDRPAQMSFAERWHFQTQKVLIL